MWRLPLMLLLVTCCSEGNNKPPEGQIWSTACPPNHTVATLNPDGTFIEATDGRGRWHLEEKALTIEVLQEPSVEFMSLYPELISLDQDRVLPFVGERTIEAERDGLKQLFHRCS